MKIAYTSDTHYGFSSKTHKIHVSFLKESSDICISENVDLIIHCGDWISHNQHQLPRTWKMFREAFGDLPILAVKGNHDLWDYDYWGVHPKRRSYAKHPSGMSYSTLVTQHRDWANEFGITLLQDNYFEKDDVIITGFDGWYSGTDTGTNDASFMFPYHESCPISPFLSSQAYKCLDNAINLVNQDKYSNFKKICVTHHPPYSKNPAYLKMCANPNYLKHITTSFDYLFVGHSHQTEDWINEEVVGNEVFSCRVLNPGTDFDKNNHGYDNPRLGIIEI